MVKVVLHLLHLSFDSPQLLIHSLGVELGNLSHRLLHEPVDILHEDRPFKKLLELHHLVEHFLKLRLPSLCVLLQYLIYFVLKEDLLQ